MPKSYRKSVRLACSSVKNRKICAYFGTCRFVCESRANSWMADTSIFPPALDIARPAAVTPAFSGRQKTGLNGISRQFAKMFQRQMKFGVRQAIFCAKIAAKQAPGRQNLASPSVHSQNIREPDDLPGGVQQPVRRLLVMQISTGTCLVASTSISSGSCPADSPWPMRSAPIFSADQIPSGPTVSPACAVRCRPFFFASA